MNENDARVIQTKKDLHRALLSILKAQPLETISVSALCRKAVVSRGAFYMHYKDIRSLFDEHIRSLLQDLEESYYEPYRHAAHIDPRSLDPSTIRIFHHVKKYQPFYEIVFDRQSSLSYYYALLTKIKSLIRESAVQEPMGDNDISMLVAYQANAIMGLLIEWSEDGFSRSPEYMNKQLTIFLKMQGGEASSSGESGELP